jgi:hypothetical protein
MVSFVILAFVYLKLEEHFDKLACSATEIVSILCLSHCIPFPGYKYV